MSNLDEDDKLWLETYDSKTIELVSKIINKKPRARAAELQTMYNTLETDLKNYESKRGLCSCGAKNKTHRKNNAPVCSRGKAGCKGTYSTHYRRFGFKVVPKVRRLHALQTACKTVLSEIQKDAASEEA